MTTLSKELNEQLAILINDDAKRDTIIIELVTVNKLSLDKATKVYAQYASENGLTKAIISHKAEALDWLANNHPIDQWDADAVKSAVIDLTDAYGVAESTARDYCKAYSKDNGVVLPVADPREMIFQWFLAHGVDADKQDFIDYATDLGRSRSNANEYWKGYELHQFLVANGGV